MTERHLTILQINDLHGYLEPHPEAEAMLPLMNSLQFDAMTLHWEFAYGPAQVRKLAAARQSRDGSSRWASS